MSNKIKRKIIKIQRILIIAFVICCVSGIISTFFNNVYAEDEANINLDLTGLIGDAAFIGISAFFSGIPFILLTAVKLLIVTIGLIFQILISGFVWTFNTGGPNFVSLKDIIFSGADNSNIDCLDIDFFNFTTDTNAMQEIKYAIAEWYYILRLISAVILLVILIYVGIRMAISTVADEQAKYKQMLADWATSLALLFLLHYIIIFITTINKTLLNALYAVSTTDSDILLDALSGAIWLVGIEGIFAAVVYFIYLGMMLKFLYMYIKRLITIGFLIMIAPLITITYSIDKMGDGKAQALNAWLKELVYNILIQPFHCVIYLAFFDVILGLIKGSIGIGYYILAIIIMKFMGEAEHILRKIFHFDAHSLGSIKESGQSLMNATGKFAKYGMMAGAAVGAIKTSGGFSKLKNAAMEKKAMGQLHKEFNKKTADDFKKEGFKDGHTPSWSEYKKSQAGQERLVQIKNTNSRKMKEKAMKKREAKAKKYYDKEKGTSGAYERDIEKNIKDQYDAKHGSGAYERDKENAIREEYDKKHNPGDYDKLKDQSKQTLKDGRPTADAQKAQAKLKQAEKDAKLSNNDFNKQVSDIKESFDHKTIGDHQPVRRTIKGKTGEAWSNFKNPRTEYGKFMKSSLGVATNLASGLAGAGFGLGLSGDLQGAITGGQLFYGVTKGFQGRTSKTVSDETNDACEKYLKVTGMNPEDIESYINSVALRGNRKEFEAKELINKMDELKNILEKNLGSNNKSDIDLFINQLNHKIISNGENIDIDQMLDKLEQDTNVDLKSSRDEIKMTTEEYTKLSLDATVYKNIQVSESQGITREDLAREAITHFERNNT